MSASIWAPTSRCPSVRSKGSRASKASLIGVLLRDATVGRQRGRLSATLGQEHLEHEGLLEPQALDRRVDVVLSRGPVDRAQGVDEAEESAFDAQALGQGVREVRQLVEHDVHGLAHLPRGDRLAGRVDRDEGTGEGEQGRRILVHAVGQQLELGVRQLPLAVEPAELPREQASPAHGQLPLAPLLVEEGQRHRGLPVADRRLEDRPAPLPHRAHGDLGDLGHHGDLLALTQGRQVGQLPPRRVATRVVAQQVLDGQQAQSLAQGVGRLAAEHGGELAPQEAVGRRAHSTPMMIGQSGCPPS